MKERMKNDTTLKSSYLLAPTQEREVVEVCGKESPEEWVSITCPWRRHEGREDLQGVLYSSCVESVSMFVSVSQLRWRIKDVWVFRGGVMEVVCEARVQRKTCLFCSQWFYESVLGVDRERVSVREGEVRKGLILVSRLLPGCSLSAELILGVVLVQQFDMREGKVAALAFTFTLPLAVHVYFGHLHQVPHL